MTPRSWLGLGGLLAIAAGLRFVGLDWDSGQLFHPDERNLVEAAARLGLGELRDPGFYAYNGLTLYIDRILASLVAWGSNQPSLATDPSTLASVGRVVSALCSMTSVAAGSLKCAFASIALSSWNGDATRKRLLVFTGAPSTFHSTVI